MKPFVNFFFENIWTYEIEEVSFKDEAWLHPSIFMRMKCYFLRDKEIVRGICNRKVQQTIKEIAKEVEML